MKRRSSCICPWADPGIALPFIGRCHPPWHSALRRRSFAFLDTTASRMFGIAVRTFVEHSRKLASLRPAPIYQTISEVSAADSA